MTVQPTASESTDRELYDIGMALDCTVSWDTAGGHTVCHPRGDLDAFTVVRFRQAIAEVPSASVVIIDLSDVPFIDSAGLGALVGGIRRIRDLGGEAVVSTNRPVHRSLLHTTGFDRIVTITDDVAGAVDVLAT
ncbi:MAG TPA: STAS domain-containing protein [Acidimicrobiales bacterium]|nr:STAS domain-containing protein [Acidimicrobiales bacterium]